MSPVEDSGSKPKATALGTAVTLRGMSTTAELITQLEHPDAGQRRQAALALGSSGDETAAPALVARLGSEANSCVREDLTWATVQMIDATLPAVLAMLISENPDDRRTGAHVLSKVGDPAHFERLAPLVDDQHADVAIKAYRAVANTAAPQAPARLATRLGDGDALQRDALSAAFCRLGEPAVPVLVEALDASEARVREHAAEALGYLGGAAAAAAAALTTSALTDEAAEVRLMAASALRQLGEAAIEGLGQLSGSSDATVAAVAGRSLTC